MIKAVIYFFIFIDDTKNGEVNTHTHKERATQHDDVQVPSNIRHVSSIPSHIPLP